jgi:uncharacterized membrane protein
MDVTQEKMRPSRSRSGAAILAELSEKRPEASPVYLITVVLLMAVLPISSIGAEHFWFHRSVPVMLLVGKWFVFWGAGVRLFLAGLRQFFQPRFTSEKIFNIRGDDALPLVRELGVANFATGIVGMASLAKPSFVLPVAIIAALFYGIAGIRHAAEGGKSGNENIAMGSDLAVSLVFAAYVGFVALARTSKLERYTNSCSPKRPVAERHTRIRPVRP